MRYWKCKMLPAPKIGHSIPHKDDLSLRSKETIMKRKKWTVALFLALTMVLQTGVFAQTQITTGVIQGILLDPQGAVVAGANVEVKNPATNFTKTVTSDGEGRFVFLQLDSGRYVLTASKQGFATTIQENLELT